MANIKIDDATNAQLDYAAAVGQGWVLRTFGDLEDVEKSLGMGEMFIWTKGKEVLYSLHLYRPTTDQLHGGELIDNFKITTDFERIDGECGAKVAGVTMLYVFDKSKLIAAVKAFLWSKHPDGMIPIIEVE